MSTLARGDARAVMNAAHHSPVLLTCDRARLSHCHPAPKCWCMVKEMTDATRRRVSRIGSVLAPREGASPSTYEGKTYLRLLPRFLAVFCPRSGPRPAFFRRRCRSGGRMTRDAPPRPVDTLEISLGPSTVKVLTKAVQCASRIGTNHSALPPPCH